MKELLTVLLRKEVISWDEWKAGKHDKEVVTYLDVHLEKYWVFDSSQKEMTIFEPDRNNGQLFDLLVLVSVRGLTGKFMTFLKIVKNTAIDKRVRALDYVLTSSNDEILSALRAMCREMRNVT